MLQMVNEPMITVVMAIYKPNLKWLKEELESINKQSYRNFKILVWNDCPEDKYNYTAFFKQYLEDIPFEIFKSEQNMGSNGAFERLTMLVDTPYIAYCDQDDIWYEDKLEVLLNTIQKEEATLVFSDMAVIDENSKLVSHNIAGIRPRQKFYPGRGALEHLLAKNFVTGCTMMLRTDIAKVALPFPKSVFHDWWLAVCAAIKGNIAMAPKPLIEYRIYSGNQSAMLKGIHDKKSYYDLRIKKHKEFIDYIYKVLGDDLRIIKFQEWNYARENYFFHPNFSTFKNLISAWNYNRSTILLEIILPFMPEYFFKEILKRAKSGKL